MARPRLTDRLTEGLGRKLTLVSAPAGFGKTTLLSEWLHRRNMSARATWLSLDEADNDPVRFWTYVIAALRTIVPALDTFAEDVHHLSRQAPAESLLTAVINVLASDQDGDEGCVVLVLDDYHLIRAQPIHHGLQFLLEHLPDDVHLVLSTRVDPPLPLARLRARDQLTELRAADLRFTLSEVAAFLERVGTELAAEEVDTLAKRTEGWIAGLQLAALSIQQKDNEQATDFIRGFAGDNRYIVEYLAEEVFRQQPDDIQTFLRQTSILDRMCASLCAAVTGRDDSQAILEDLERSNLFVVPLDATRNWYRYHHLFAQFLRTRMQREQPEKVPELHRRAAEWYEQNDVFGEAITHALHAEEYEWAARLIRQVGDSFLLRGEVATLMGWLDALPDELIRAHPGLSLLRAWALLHSGRLDAVETCLENLERSLHTTSADPHATSVDTTVDTGSILGHVAAIRAIEACYRGDVSRAIKLSHRALADLPDEDAFIRSLVASNLALNIDDDYGSHDDLMRAEQIFADTAATSRTAGDVHTLLFALRSLANLWMVRGQLREAGRTYREALQVATQNGPPSSVVIGLLHVEFGELLYEWNDLDAAAEHVNRGIEWAEEHAAMRTVSVGFGAATGYILRARLAQAHDDTRAALEFLREAERIARRSNVTWIQTRVAAWQARLALMRDDLTSAIWWAQDCELRVGDDIGYRREGEYTTLARVLLAQDKADEAMVVLGWLQNVTEEIGLTTSLIEVLMLQALCHDATGNAGRAKDVLQRALCLAQPEGYFRLFVDEGAPMAQLLKDSGLQVEELSEYVDVLLKQFGKDDSDLKPETLNLQPLAEPLTQRQREVVALIAAGLTNREIAEKLVITVGTVKRHAHNIYGKLGVSNRTEAAARARELDLLPD